MMSNSGEPLLLGLDLGTTVCKAVVYTPSGSEVVAVARPVNTYRPHAGWAEQDPYEWMSTVTAVLTDAVQQLEERAAAVRAIAVSAHGPGLILTDADLKPLANSPTWQDQRGVSQGRWLMEHAGLDWIGLGLPETGFPAKILWAQQNLPDVYERSTHVLGIKAFLIGFLTGRALEEPSSGPGGPQWPDAVFAELGIGTEALAPIRPSTGVAGLLRTELAAATGLLPDTRVIMGLNDGASATLGAGLSRVGDGIVSLSTNGVARTLVSARVPGEIQLKNALFCYPYLEDLYVTGGITKAGGDSLSWFMEVAYRDVPSGKAAFRALEREAGTAPRGARGVHFIPYLVGRGTPHTTAAPEGAFLHMARHHERGDLTRAVMEGVAYALRDIGAAFARLDFPWRSLRLTGGGARNQVWRQLLAEVLGRRLTMVSADSTLGAAIVAAVALGLYDNTASAIEAMTSEVGRIVPDAQGVHTYDEEYRRFCSESALLLGETFPATSNGLRMESDAASQQRGADE